MHVKKQLSFCSKLASAGTNHRKKISINEMGRKNVMSECIWALLEGGKDLPVIRGSFGEEWEKQQGKRREFRAMTEATASQRTFQRKITACSSHSYLSTGWLTLRGLSGRMLRNRNTRPGLPCPTHPTGICHSPPSSINPPSKTATEANCSGLSRAVGMLWDGNWISHFQ